MHEHTNTVTLILCKGYCGAEQCERAAAYMRGTDPHYTLSRIEHFHTLNIADRNAEAARLAPHLR